jgi:hypothetical protein
MELSDRVRGLKFMQRKAEKERRMSLESQRLNEAQWGAERTKSPFVMLAEVQADISKKVKAPPRRSFKKFNPAVDKLEQEYRVKRAAAGKKRARSVDSSLSKEKMAERMVKIKKGESFSDNEEEEEEEIIEESADVY